MARPMLLLNENILKELHRRHTTGIFKGKPMIKLYDLTLTSTTLKSKMQMYLAMIKSEGELFDVMHKSLFPEWLDDKVNDVQTQDQKKWRYVGDMPFGVWERLDTA